MLKELIKLANELDSKGFRKEADFLDGIIKRVATEEAHVERVQKQPWMQYGNGMVGDRIMVIHNGTRHRLKSGEPMEGRPKAGGPDRSGQGAATLVFYRKTINGIHVGGYPFHLLFNNDGKAIGYGIGRGSEWLPHFHAPSNGWPEGTSLTITKPAEPYPDHPRFAPELWSLPSPSPAL